jgi:tetratricopeptide (TPR) repeat protein
MSHLPRNAGRTLRCCAAALLLLSFAAAAFAQSSSGESRDAVTISGVVRDISGAVVADATIVLEEKANAASVEAKTVADGTFSFSALYPGTFVVCAQKAGFRETVSDPLELSLGQKRQIELVLSLRPGNLAATNEKSASSCPPKSSANSSPMQFDDKPSFTVAGITDWTNVGGHGSDTKLRTSESLAKETASLKASPPAETPAPVAASHSAADAHRLAGDRAERSRDPVTAEREYKEAVSLDPSEPNYFAWGAELLLHRAIGPASQVFSKGADAHPKSARMLAGLGAALYASGDYENAARRLCAAADLQPADPTPYIFLGKMEKAAPDPLPCAADKLARFAHDQPNRASANYYFAVALWRESRAADAGTQEHSQNSPKLQQVEALLQKAVAADPNLDEAYTQLGVVYAARGNSQQAIAAYKKAIEVNPHSAEAHYRLALAYKRAGEQAKSEQELKLYKEADKAETAAIEQQRREIRQFMIILKDQPHATAPQPR